MPHHSLVFCVVVVCLGVTNKAQAELSAGAAVVDISPTQMPVIVNGGMLTKKADQINTTINARALVLDDGADRIAIVVVDSCMVPRELLDNAKNMAAKQTEIPADRICISATHTHSAPSSFAALGTSADATYVPLIRQRIVEAIVAAEKNLQPARIGWGSANAAQFTALRRWVRRPDRLDIDPFGNHSVRANMHAAQDLDNVTGESGPEDPELSMIAVQSTEGVPIAILCNFSMHYFSDRPISADYFGLFSDQIAAYAAKKHATAKKHAAAKNVVGIMSHGCSGDVWRRDYMTWDRKNEPKIDQYAQGLVKIAVEAYDAIKYESDTDIAMAETRLPLNYRLPDAQRLQWAQKIVDEIQDDTPKDRTEVYAREQVLLNQMQKTEIVLQAIRIGEIGIATTPCETYALSGLKLKEQSPMKHTMVIELANGADGYIPPAEQHPLGGYNTWAARSAGLEVQAEPKIVATDLRMLEQISGKPRKRFAQVIGKAAQNILDQKPIAYWRLDEMEATVAVDSSGNHNDAQFDPGVLFFLPGPESSGDAAFSSPQQPNRAVHLAGGRIEARLADLGKNYTVVMSFWNGMPVDGRETTGWLFSRDHHHAISAGGLHLGLSGSKSGEDVGKLMIQNGANEIVVGKTAIERWTWNQVALVRHDNQVRVFLNGNETPEIETTAIDFGPNIPSCFIGGRCDNDSNWEGRVDEVAIFNRALTADEIP